MTGKQTTELAAGIKGKMTKLDAAVPVEYTLRFILAFILARGEILASLSPFGVGFVAAMPPGAAGIVALAGAAAGYITTQGIGGVLSCLSVMLLIRTVLWIMSGSAAAEHPLFAPGAAAAAAGAVGLVYAAAGGWQAVRMAAYAVNTALCGGLTYFYSAALSPLDENAGQEAKTVRTSSTVILLASVLLSLSSVTFFGGISAGRAAAAAAVMLSALLGGTGRGCACGVLLGAAMDLSCGTVPFFTMVYGVSALISGVFAKNGRLLFLLSFIAAHTAAVIWAWEGYAMLPALYEVFIASVTVMVLPDQVIARISAFFPLSSTGYGFFKAREYTRERVELTGEAFRELYSAVRAADDEAENTENVSVIFDRAADGVCRTCRRAAECWQRDYNDTYDILNGLSSALLQKGEAAEEDFPVRFSEKCEHFPALLAAVNAETRLFICRRQFRRRLRDNRGAAYNQYADIAAVLKSLSDELGSDISVESALEKRLGKYLRGLGITSSAAVFRMKGGRLRAEICSPQLHLLTADGDYLSQLSAVLGARMCTSCASVHPDRLVLLESEPLCATVGSACVKKQGQSVSGDRGTFFRTDEGLLYILLCDGMGTGEEAARSSSCAAGALEKLLKAGVAPELSLRILGDLMLLKNDSSTDSSTVDMLCFDLFSGETRIFKYGAAPSYLKKSSAVKKISCTSFSAGLLGGREGGPRVYASAKTAPGSMTVMVTDGVTSGGDDKWLGELIGSYSGSDPRELARLILKSAVEHSGCTDDMTAIVVAAGDRK